MSLFVSFAESPAKTPPVEKMEGSKESKTNELEKRKEEKVTADVSVQPKGSDSGQTEDVKEVAEQTADTEQP